jgi:hypothetical protein
MYIDDFAVCGGDRCFKGFGTGKYEKYGGTIVHPLPYPSQN